MGIITKTRRISSFHPEIRRESALLSLDVRYSAV
jgi:hypothetical protein